MNLASTSVMNLASTFRVEYDSETSSAYVKINFFK